MTNASATAARTAFDAHFRRHLAATVAMMALAAPGAALAQSGQAPSAASTLADDNVIVVTAQKRAESIQQVPATIQAFTSAKLENVGIRSLDDLTMVTPGLTMPRVGAGVTPYIRGIGTAVAGGGQEGAVAVYVDGTYLLDSSALSLDTSNVERIEVLKGPQGTLFGRNATGGMVNVITKDPSQQFGGNVRVYGGNYKRYGGDFYVTGGLAEDVSANLSMAVERQDEGFGRNIFPNPIGGSHKINFRNLFTTRGKVQWDNGDTRLLLSADYTYRQDDAGYSATLFPGSLGIDGAFIYGGCVAGGGSDADCRAAAIAGATRRPTTGFNDVNSNVTTRAYNRSYGGYLRFEHDFGAAKFLSLSSYRHDRVQIRFDNDYTPVAATDVLSYGFTNESFTQEFQLSSNTDSPFSWIGGLYYLWAKGGTTPRVTGLAIGAPIPGIAPDGVSYLQIFGDIRTRSYAAFAEVNYKLTDALKLTLGGRFTRDERRSFGGQEIGAIDPSAPGGVTPVFITADQKKNFQKFTWRAVAQYAITDDVNVYGSYNVGFKSGNFNAASALDPAVQPETIDAYEVGLKSQLFDRRLTFNAAGFYYDYSNLQLLVPSGVGTRIENAAKARIKGVEFDANYRVNSLLTLYGSLSRLWTKYISYPAAATYEPTGFGGNMLVVQDVSGNRLAKTPNLTFNLGGLLTVPTSVGKVSATANWSYTGEIHWDPDGRLRQDPYSLVNASLGWQSLNEALGLKFSVRNLTNAQYCLFCTAVGIADLYGAGQPRTFTAEVTYKF